MCYVMCVQLVSRLRGGDKGQRSKLLEEQTRPTGPPPRDRSRSLCVEKLATLLRPGYDPATLAARDLNLHALQRRRASSAM